MMIDWQLMGLMLAPVMAYLFGAMLLSMLECEAER